jgi:hypothetical protein
VQFLRSCFEFISELFESYFQVDFLSHFAGNSGLFPKNKKGKMLKIGSNRPKQFFLAMKNKFYNKFKTVS